SGRAAGSRAGMAPGDEPPAGTGAGMAPGAALTVSGAPGVDFPGSAGAPAAGGAAGGPPGPPCPRARGQLARPAVSRPTAAIAKVRLITSPPPSTGTDGTQAAARCDVRRGRSGIVHRIGRRL